MGPEGNSPDPDYYPFRWKVADAAEDLVALHRGRLLAVLALLLVALTVGAIVFLGGDDDEVVTAPTSDDSTTSTESPDTTPTTSAAPGTSASTTEAPTTTSTTEAPTTTSTTEAPTTTAAPSTTISQRAPASAEQLAGTEPGSVLELAPELIRIVGGLPNDDLADANVALAESTFGGLAVDDVQIVDESFPPPTMTRFRLSAADLFGYNSDVLNAQYLPLVDQVAGAMTANESWTVEVTGHTDDTGPAEGNQRLSERRAQSAANRLIGQGVDPARITVRGLGENEPLVPNDTDANRLRNRRVEFDVTP